jgi:membrane-associated phospholipid phosphatase/GTP:adenosylcobinamide-phosphate guanylyltransferase
MDAVILAGGKPNRKNKIWPESNDIPKPMMVVNGRPMVQWVIDAVNKSKAIEKIYIVGLEKTDTLNFEKPFISIPDCGGIFKNLAAAAERIIDADKHACYFLSISADIPLIDEKIIDSVALKPHENGFDIFYNIIDKKLMEEKFPGVKRTYIRFKDGKFCGGDMHVINTRACISPAVLSFEKYRKNPVKLISSVGFIYLFKMIFSPPSVFEAAKIIFSQTGILGKPIKCSFPELGMDIDNPSHLKIITEILTKKTKQINVTYKKSVNKTELGLPAFKYYKWISHTGDSLILFPLLILLFTIVSENFKVCLGSVLTGMAVTGIFVWILKQLIRKKRPRGKEGKIYRKYDPYSFPSGHAARTFVIATIFIGCNWITATGLFFWAMVVSGSRLKLQLHFAVDIIAGALIGTGVGILIILVQFIFNLNCKFQF